jgi:hypothetical protein
MSEPNRMNPNTDNDNAEVELSAEDLRALAAVCESNPGDPATSTAHPVGNPTIPSAASASCPRTNAWLAVSFALVAGITAVIAIQTNVIPNRSPEKATAVSHQSAFEREWVNAQPDGDPVRFANPFDASEVFEFSPGTTESEARDAVAEFLIERAMNRQARLDGKSSRRR